MKRIKFYLPILALIAISFVSCEKDEVTERLTVDALDVASASTLSEQTVVDMQTMGEEALTPSLKSTTTEDSLIVPSRDRFRFNGDSTSITIDFGTGVECRDGRIRKGKIIITRNLSPTSDSVGNVIVFTTDGYVVNGNKVSITKTVTCKGWTVDNEFPNGYLLYDVVVEDGIIERANGDIITVNVNHTRKLVAFEGGYRFAGWVIGGTSTHQIERSVSGKIIGATNTISRELQRPLRYHHFIAGEVDITYLSGESVTVDYGTGNLFDKATWGKRKIVRSGNDMESQEQD